MTIQVPDDLAKRIAVQKRVWVARDFTYNRRTRRLILDLCAPLFLSTHLFQAPHDAIPDFTKSPAELCIRMVERRASEALLAYLSRGEKPRPASERDRLLRIAHAARLIRDLTKDEPGMWQPIGDWEERARDRAARIRDEFGHPWHRVHDPIRLRLALDTLNWQVAETKRRPVRSYGSDANQLIYAAVDPVMKFANDRLGIVAARRLADNGDAGLYIIGQMLSGRFDDPANVGRGEIAGR